MFSRIWNSQLRRKMVKMFELRISLLRKLWDWKRNSRGKSCQQVCSELKLAAKIDGNACPACQFLLEKISGCDHITCTNCSYEFCWICHASYSPGHLKLHEIARISVSIPGQTIPLQISETQHKLYRFHPGTGVQSSVVEGNEIVTLFRDHKPVKMVKINTKDPITGKQVIKEGILLRKNPELARQIV